jgi:hypothetical protein
MKLTRSIKMTLWAGLFLFFGSLLVAGLILSEGRIFTYTRTAHLCDACATIEHKRTLSILDFHFSKNWHEDSLLKQQAFARIQHTAEHKPFLPVKNTDYRLDFKSGYQVDVQLAVVDFQDDAIVAAAFGRLAEKDFDWAIHQLFALCSRLEPWVAGIAVQTDGRLQSFQSDTLLLEFLESTDLRDGLPRRR